MTILFAQSWDVIPGKYDEYSPFVSNEYNPTLEKLGLKLLGGYYVAVGEGPRIIAVATIEGQAGLMKILADSEYRVITNKLWQVVFNYSNRVWVPSGRIQDEPYRIQTGAWKFNQYYNVIPGQGDAHYRFVKEECIPGMKALGIPITAGWRLAIGSGPKMLAECTGRNIEKIAQAINTSEFRRLVRPLKKYYAMDYSSRILAPTGRIEIPFIMKEMMKGF
ncbi:MAG: hypothetical protein JSW26_09700 [Desulfobacterales bacterium]|nr:MAG: hypothetical protein JSW26_09700 [Desulfobacterales bacterium]